MNTASASNSANQVDPYLWTLDLNQIQKWLRESYALFPKSPKPRLDSHGNPISLPSGGSETSPDGTGEEAPSKFRMDSQTSIIHRLEQEELQRQELSEYKKQVAIVEILFQNLMRALESASSSSSTSSTFNSSNNHDTNYAMNETGLSNAKRIKMDTDNEVSSNHTLSTSRGDLYSILDPSFAQGEGIVYLPGAILSRMSVGGIVNALAGQIGGVVDVSTNAPTLPHHQHDPTLPIPSAADQSLAILQNTHAKKFHRSLSARLEMDVLNSTPTRIVQMLCPDISMQDITGIRKRIYDTVILGKGTNSSAIASSMEGGEDVPVAARTSLHDIEKFQKCKICGNNNQSFFVLDKTNGDLICTECGTVATESLMHEGSQFRKFEGEEDRNHHGDIANPLYSNSHNMGTTLSGMSIQRGAGMGGYGSSNSTTKRGLENILRNAHSYIEMNISQFGKEEKKTRIGYKDRQKKEAFVHMNHVADSLSLHQAVLQRAKILFAGFRDDRELVQQFKGVVAACLIEAFDQLSKDGKQLLKVRSGEDLDDIGDETISARASKRISLHSTLNAAGNGGILFSLTANKMNSTSVGMDTSGGNSMNSMEAKPVALWNLDDTRTWLLEACRSIARQWSDQREEADKNKLGVIASSQCTVPNGSIDELEGKLVEHTLTLCHLLESELKNDQTSISGRRISTPRVAELGKLAIKWQHTQQHRGAGNSNKINTNGSMQGEKTAGQLLILKTAKKYGEILNDRFAGEAFHRELRSLLVRQEERRKRELSEEFAKQRLMQMRRKPWLQARAEKQN